MEEIKNNEDKNKQRLREEFNQKQKQNENHPKTSHGIKHSINQYINNNQYNHSKKYKSYNKALSANKYKQNVKTNHFFYKNNFPISKNHPGYLYYKEIMKYTKRTKKRNFTGKAINRNYKLEPIISNNKNIYEGYHRFNDKFPKIINGDKYSMNERRTYYNNKSSKNNKYFPFWVDNKKYNKNDYIFDIKGISYGAKQLNNTINKKNELALKVLNKNKENNSFKKKSLDSYNDNLNQKKVYYNNFMNKEVNKLSNGKKIKEKTNTKNNINNNNNLNDNKEKVFNNIFNLNEKEKSDNINNEQNKEEIINNDVNEDIDEEKEKIFYTNQKNFFKVRKDIMEEPEYLEEDNETEIKKEENK